MPIKVHRKKRSWLFFYAAKRLRLPYLSAYLDSIGASFRHGANFATGGSTIRQLNESFFLTGASPFSLDIQIVQFDQFKTRTSKLYNKGKTKSPEKKLFLTNLQCPLLLFMTCSQEKLPQKKSPKASGLLKCSLHI